MRIASPSAGRERRARPDGRDKTRAAGVERESVRSSKSGRIASTKERHRRRVAGAVFGSTSWRFPRRSNESMAWAGRSRSLAQPRRGHRAERVQQQQQQHVRRNAASSPLLAAPGVCFWMVTVGVMTNSTACGVTPLGRSEQHRHANEVPFLGRNNKARGCDNCRRWIDQACRVAGRPGS